MVPKELKRQIMEELDSIRPEDAGSFEELQEIIAEKMNAINHSAKPDFEGYSSTDMHYILYDPLDKKSPLHLNELSPQSYSKIPLLNLFKYFLNKLAEEGELKLTEKGNLPIKWVKDLHQQNFLQDYAVKAFEKQIRIEEDSRSIRLTKMMSLKAGWVKKRKGKLSLSKLGDRERKDDSRLFKRLWRHYTTEYNWAYSDGYISEEIGIRAFVFSLILVSKYGDTTRDADFYADKYFMAFPYMIPEMTAVYGLEMGVNFSFACYILRTFDHFMNDFGLVRINSVRQLDFESKRIKKTPLFDEFITILPSLTQ